MGSMADRGRDIPPDEDRPGSFPAGLPAHDVEEDGMLAVNSVFHTRGNFHAYEPMDETADAVGRIEERVFPPRTQQVSNAAAYYKSEENRLRTFRDWRYQDTVRKEDLAKNGFIFTGTGDKVRCVYCNGMLRQWDRGDIVEEEHRNNYPQCPFVLGRDVGNIPFHPTTNGYNHHDTSSVPQVTSRTLVRGGEGHDIDPIEDRCGAQQSQHQYTNGYHVSDAVSGTNNSTGEDVSPRRAYSSPPRNPRMAVEPDRLQTFETWPAQMKQKPKQLAQAGLYYTGDGDKVKCFHCDVLLYGWEPEDDPFVEHARWYPDCEYIRLVKGESFVRDVQSGKNNPDQVMETPAVLAVLYEGHDMDIVRKAVDAMKAKNGPDTVISADKLLSVVLEIEDAEKGATNHVNGGGLPEDVEKLKNEYESLKEKQQCKICMDSDVEVIFYPCKHFVCCASCGASVRECPICRVRVQSMDKVYMS